MAEADRQEQPGKPAPAGGEVRPTEQPTQPAEEWGQREATGEEIASGGRNAGPSPGRQERRSE